MNTIETSTNPTLLQMLIRSKVKAIPLLRSLSPDDDDFLSYANYRDGKSLPIPKTHDDYITSIMYSLNKNDSLLKQSIMGLLAINIFKEYYEKKSASDKVKQLNNLKERIQKLKKEEDGQKELALNTILREAHNLIPSEESRKIEKFIKDAYRKKSLPDLYYKSLLCTNLVSFTYSLIMLPVCLSTGVFSSWSALNILIAASPAVIFLATLFVLLRIEDLRYRHADNLLKENFLTFVEKNDICNLINTHVGYDKHCLDAIETACKEVKTKGMKKILLATTRSMCELILCLKKNISPELACFCMNRIIASADQNDEIYNVLIAQRAELLSKTTISNLKKRREHFNAQFGYIFEQQNQSGVLEDYKPSAPPSYEDLENGTTELSQTSYSEEGTDKSPPPQYSEVSWSM